MKSITELRNAALTSDSAAAFFELGTALVKRYERDAGLQCFRDAIARNGSIPQYHWRLGSELFTRGDIDEAATCFERALAVEPTCEEALSGLAWLSSLRFNERVSPRQRRERNETARALFHRLLTRSPRRSDYYLGFCRTWVEAGGSVPQLLRAARQSAGDGCDALLLQEAMARALSHYARYADARDCLDDLQRQHPPNPDVLVLRARVEEALDDSQAALACYEAAWTQFPNHERGLLDGLNFLASIGDYPRAQQIYRRPATQQTLHSRDAGPRWRGEPIEGKTVLFRALGGYGDMIHWSRFAMLMVERGAKVLVQCGTPIRTLLARLPTIQGVVVPHDEPTPYDVRCDDLSAMMLLDWDWATIRRQTPYLQGPRERAAAWRSEVRRDDADDFHVGVTWRAGFEFPSRDDYYTGRSIPLASLQELFGTPGVVFHNLYLGPLGEAELAAASPAPPLRPLSKRFTTFDDTAAAIQALDLVVAVDTSTGHLAGALGTPCLLMLPYLSCWRWMRKTATTDWYASVHLYRQPAPGDWRSVTTAIQRTVVACRDRAAQQRLTASPATH